MIIEAILKINPNAKVSVSGNDINTCKIEWHNGTTPISKEDIVREITHLEYLDEVNQYQNNRSKEYPELAEQLDYIYHNGIDAWKTNIINPVKTQFPKQEIDETELENRKNKAINDYVFNKQYNDYSNAIARLAQYQVALGREQVTEMQNTEEHKVDANGEFMFDEQGNPIYVQQEVVLVTAIEPVEATVEIKVSDENNPEAEPTIQTIENPLITKDNEERANAQSVVDATPQEVINKYNLDNPPVE